MATSDTSVHSRRVEVNGQTLHYRQWPQNGPPLIFLHGVTGSLNSWDPIAPAFASDYSVMAFDLRGHGQSSKPERGYTWAGDYAADIVAFVNEHVSERVILVGHSLGAMVSPPVAVGASEMVRAIVMEDPPAFAPSEDRQQTSDRFRPILAVKRLPREMRVERLMETMGITREAAIQRADNLEAMAEQVLTELLEGGNAYRPDDWFPRVSCPSLVILGHPERGGVIAWDDRPRLRRLLPDAKVVEWDDVGHGIHAEQPERFIAEVKAFLSGLPA